jgi:hypothetical protein
MRRNVVAGLVAGLALAAPTAASSMQVGDFLLGKQGGVGAKYRDGNVIRAHASMGRDGSPQQAYRLAMIKIAEMASAKGYARIGVTKVSDCGTLKMNGSITVAHSCRILAQMVRADEDAKPEGKAPVVYFSVPEIMMGAIRPETERMLSTFKLPDAN